ncbi:hypothetical protein TMatcc_001586 [Talaromyces marneffei ATCC 18224]
MLSSTQPCKSSRARSGRGRRAKCEALGCTTWNPSQLVCNYMYWNTTLQGYAQDAPITCGRRVVADFVAGQAEPDDLELYARIKLVHIKIRLKQMTCGLPR